MSIAERLIKKCGVDALAATAGVSRVSVHRWSYSREKGGTGGHVPTIRIPRIIAGMSKRGVHLTPADFVDAAVEAAA